MKVAKDNLTPDICWKYLEYRDGTLFWKTPRRGVTVGKSASRAHHGGKRRIMFLGSDYLEHRLIWFMFKGYWPENDIDHKDCNQINNRIENLREATRSQNLANQRRKPNSSGYKGVCYDSPTGRWRAAIKKDGRPITIGRFNSPEIAHAAYCSMALKLFGEYARAE